MFYLNTYKDSELSRSSTRDNLGIKVIRSIHAEKALVLAPHPDDDVFACGGLLSSLKASKTDLRVLYFCGGNKGNSAGKANVDLVAQREQEAVAALQEIGGAHVNFLRKDDQSLTKDNRLWEVVYEEIVLNKPNLVLMPDKYDWNADHLALYAAAVVAFRKLKRNKPKVWSYFMWGLNAPSYLLPLDHKTVKTKNAAMLCHKSQLSVRRYDEAVTGLNEYLGKALGLEQPAEGYKEVF